MPPRAADPFEALRGQLGLTGDSTSAPPDAAPSGDDLERNFGLPPGLLDAVMAKESAGDPNAVSPKGAAGAYQFMPATARSYGLRVDLGKDERLDPVKSRAAAARYLGDLHRKYGRTDLAVAAYNAGEPAVDSARGIPDYPETQQYVQRVMGQLGAPGAPAPAQTASDAATRLRSQLGLDAPQEQPGTDWWTQVAAAQPQAARPETAAAPAPPVPGPATPDTGGYQPPRITPGPGGDLAMQLPDHPPQGEVNVPPKSATDYEQKRRELAQWWESGGKALPPDQIRRLGPEYAKYADYITGKGGPTIGPPPAEYDMTGGQLARATGEQAAAGALDVVAPFAPNAPDFVKWYRQAGPTGPIGVGAGLAGTLAGYMTPAPLPLASQKVGRAAADLMIGSGAIKAANQGGKALFEDSLDALLKGSDGQEVLAAADRARKAAQAAGLSADEAESAASVAATDHIRTVVSPKAAKFSDSMSAELLKKMSGPARVWAARNLVEPSTAGLTAASIESAVGVARGEMKPDEVPEHLVGTSLGFLVAHLGWQGITAALREAGAVPRDFVGRARRGQDLTDDEKAMLERLMQRIREGRQEPASYDVPPQMVAGTPPQAPTGPVAPGEALERTGQAQALDAVLRPVREAKAREDLRQKLLAERASDKAAREASVAAAAPEDVSAAMGPLQERAKFYVERGLLSDGEVQAADSPDAIGKLLETAQARRAEEESRKLATMAQDARLAGQGIETPLPTAPEAPPPTPAPTGPVPQPPPVEEMYMPSQRERFWISSIVARAKTADEAVQMANERLTAKPGLEKYVRGRFALGASAAARAGGLKETIGKANASERARLAAGESRTKVARDIEARVAADAAHAERENLRRAAGEQPTAIGRATDLDIGRKFFGQTAGTVSAPGAPPPAETTGVAPSPPPPAVAPPAPAPPAPLSPEPAVSPSGESPAPGETPAPAAPPVKAAKRTKEQQTYVEALSSAVGQVGKMIITETGPIRIDRQVDIKKRGQRDSTTSDLHPDTIKVLNDTGLGMLKGLLVNSDGTPIDEAAQYMFDRGTGHSVVDARRMILDELMKIAKDASAGKFLRLSEQLQWGKPIDGSEGAIVTVTAGTLVKGDEFQSQDGEGWTVTSIKPGIITIENTVSQKIRRVDEFDIIPTLGGVSKAGDMKGWPGTSEPYHAYRAGGRTSFFRERSMLVREAPADWKAVPNDVKAAVIRTGAWHMRRGARDVEKLTAAMVGDFGDRVRPFVQNVFALLSRTPEFASPAAQPAGAAGPTPTTPVPVGSPGVAPPKAPEAPVAKPATPAPAGGAGGANVRPEPRRTQPALGQPVGAGGGARLPAAQPGGRARPVPGVEAGPAAPPPEKAAKAPKPEKVEPTRTLRPGGIATISQELLPPLEPEWKSILDRLTQPAGLDKLGSMFGTRPLEHQVENMVRILRAFKLGRAPVLADGGGTGKTLSAIMVINEHLLNNPNSRTLVVLPNQEIKKQWERTLKRAGIAAHYVEGALSPKPMTVNFMTYKRLEIWGREKNLGLIEGFAPDLLIFDESHRLRNFYTGDTETAKLGVAITGKTDSGENVAKNVLFMSGTPFESFLHTAYLGRTGLWEPKKKWEDWIFDLTGIYKDRDGGWVGASPKTLRKVHEAMYRGGVMMKHELDFNGIKNSKGEKITVTAEHRMAKASPEHAAEQHRMDGVFGSVLEELQQDAFRNRNRIRLVAGVQHLFNRSMDETEKVRQVIEHARARAAEGKSVIFMLLRKNETSAERWLADFEAGKREYNPKSFMPELINILKDHGIKTPSPVATLRRAFPDAVMITGDEPSGGGKRASAIEHFQAGKAKVAIVTMASGAEGLDLQDTTGDHPRIMYVASVPYTAGQASQVAWRPFRLGSESNAEIVWLFTDSAQDFRQARLVAARDREMGALVRGEVESPTADERERFNFPELNKKPVEMPGLEASLGPAGTTVQLEDYMYADLVPDADYNVSEQRHKYRPSESEQPELFGSVSGVRYASNAKKRGGAILSEDSALWHKLEQTGAGVNIYRERIDGPADIAAMFGFLKDRAREHMYFVGMKGDKPLGVVLHAIGGVNSARMDPHRAVPELVALGADGVYVVHNHPSQSPELSHDDVMMAASLRDLLEPHGVAMHGILATDIDRFGFSTGPSHPGPFIQKVGAMGSPIGRLNEVALAYKRERPVVGDIASGPLDAAMAYHAMTVGNDVRQTMFMARDNKGRITGHIAVPAEPRELVERPEHAESLAAVRRFLARAEHTEVLVATNRIGGSVIGADEDWFANYRTKMDSTLAVMKAALGDSVKVIDLIGVPPGGFTGVAHTTYGGRREWDQAGAKKKFQVSEPKVGRGLGGLPARSEIIRKAEEAVGTAIRVGRMGRTSRSVLGFYKRPGGQIRLRTPNDMRVVLHEIGHRLDDLIFKSHAVGHDLGSVRALARFRAELLPLATIPGRGQDPLPEGFAEFMYHYVNDPAKAARVAPTFYPWFESYMSSAKDLRVLHEGFLGLRDLMKEWNQADPWERLGSTIVSGEMPWHQFRHDMTWRHLYSYTFDQMHFLRWAQGKLEAMADGQPLRQDQNLKVLATTIMGRMGIRDIMIEHGMVRFETPGVRVGPGLREIADSIGGKWRRYETWVKALRTQYLMGRDRMGAKEFIGDAVKDAEIRQIVDDGKKEFLHVFSMQQGYSQGLLRYLVGAGMLKEEQFYDVHSKNLIYSPFWRLMDAEQFTRPGGQPGGAAGGRMASLYRGVLYTLRGSSRETFPALESLLRMTNVVVDRAERNAVVAALLQASKHLKDAGVHIAEIVPEERVPVEFRVGSVLAALKNEMGISAKGVDEEDLDKYLTVFMPSTRMPKAPYVWAWINGERKYAWIHPDVYDTLMNLEREQLPWFISWMRAGPTIVRGGAVVLNPGFWGWNEIRKVATTIIQSQAPWQNLKFMPRAFIDGLLKTDRYYKYMATGAAYATFVRQSEDAVATAIRHMLDRKEGAISFYANPVNVMRGVFTVAQRILSATDMAPRIAEARALGLDRATTRAQLLPLGAAASDVTLDYRRIGTKLKLLSGVTAFLTAHMQAIDRPVRFAKDRPGKAAAVAVTGFLLGLMYYLLNRDDKRYQNEAQENKDTYFYFYPTDDPTDPGIRMPKPYAYGWYVTAGERTAEMMGKHDPEMLNQFAWDFGRGMTPNFFPTVLQPIFEVGMNRKFNTWRKVEPDSGLPQERSFPWTTETAKDIARALSSEERGVSGPVVEHLASGFTGGLGLDLLEASDKYVLGIPPKQRTSLADEPVIGRFFSRQPEFSTNAVRRFYEQWTPAENAYQSLLQARATSPMDEMKFRERYSDLLRRRTAMQGAHTTISQGWKDLDRLQNVPMDDAARQRAENAIAQRLTWAAKMGLAAADAVK